MYKLDVEENVIKMKGGNDLGSLGGELWSTVKEVNENDPKKLVSTGPHL